MYTGGGQSRSRESHPTLSHAQCRRNKIHAELSKQSGVGTMLDDINIEDPSEVELEIVK